MYIKVIGCFHKRAASFVTLGGSYLDPCPLYLPKCLGKGLRCQSELELVKLHDGGSRQLYCAAFQARKPPE